MLKTDIIRIKLNQMSRNPVIKEIVGKIEDGKKIIHRTNRENKISSSGYSYKMKWRNILNGPKAFIERRSLLSRGRKMMIKKSISCTLMDSIANVANTLWLNVIGGIGGIG